MNAYLTGIDLTSYRTAKSLQKLFCKWFVAVHFSGNNVLGFSCGGRLTRGGLLSSQTATRMACVPNTSANLYRIHVSKLIALTTVRERRSPPSRNGFNRFSISNAELPTTVADERHLFMPATGKPETSISYMLCAILEHVTQPHHEFPKLFQDLYKHTLQMKSTIRPLKARWSCVTSIRTHAYAT